MALILEDLYFEIGRPWENSPVGWGQAFSVRSLRKGRGGEEGPKQVLKLLKKRNKLFSSICITYLDRAGMAKCTLCTFRRALHLSKLGIPWKKTYERCKKCP